MTIRTPTQRRLAAFTLVELLVAIAVGALLLALAVPSFSSMLQQNRLSAQSNALLNAMQYARSTALSQNVSVVVCPVGAANSGTCGTNWGAGWMVATSTGTLLQSYAIGPRAPSLSSVAVSGAAANTLTFDPRGLATPQGYFKLCDNRGAAFARSVQVSLTGFVQAGPTSGQAIWGGALSCP